MVLFAIAHLTLKPPREARRRVLAISVRGAIAGILMMLVALPAIFALLPNDYGRWFVFLLAVLVAFVPHQLWMWREIRDPEAPIG